MKRTILLLTFACCLFAVTCSRQPSLVRHGESAYTIVVADNASPATKHGAEELQTFIADMTGAKLPIVSDTTPRKDQEIVIGNCARLADLGVTVDFASLGEEGYVIKTVGKTILIAGGDLRGNMYGVYGLLEDHWGCRWFTPEVSRIPKYDVLPLPVLDETVVPVLEYREPYIWDAQNGDWAARNRINRNFGSLDEQRGGMIQWMPGFFVHTFEQLVPKSDYYKQHPEYFSLVNSKRIPELSQLCCTNPEVVNLVIAGVRKALREHPEANIIAVDQNDTYNFCECPKCQALAEAEGSQMAPVLQLVNTVADSIRDEFPQCAVITLAYQWTRHAPKTMRPKDNVIIRLCSIECCFTHPFDECDGETNALFYKDLQDWAKISNRLWVWNYTTDFSHYLLPFPNLLTRKHNLKLFVDNHVTGMFQQDTPNIPHGELSELGAYLHAKLLWNPDYDTDTAINEFLDAYYGAAAPSIRAYIDFTHDKVKRENIHMGCYESPETRLLDGNFFATADSLFDSAEKAVGSDNTLLERVKASRLSIEYAYVARDINDKAYKTDQASLTVGLDDDYMKRVDAFLDHCRHFGIEYLNEGGMTLDTFRERIASRVEAKTLAWREAAKVPALKPGVAWKRYRDGWESAPLFAKAKPVTTGTAEMIALPEHGPTELFGMAYEGFIDIPEDGVWSFYTNSDDGSLLYIDGAVVVDNGGRHAMEERVGFAALKKGPHPVKVVWFNGAGGLGLDVSIKGPNVDKQAIPASMLFSK